MLYRYNQSTQPQLAKIAIQRQRLRIDTALKPGFRKPAAFGARTTLGPLNDSDHPWIRVLLSPTIN